MPVRHDSLDPVAKQRHLAALEALFAPKPSARVDRPARAGEVPAPTPSTRALAKLVSPRTPADPARARLVAALVAAPSAEAVGRAVRTIELAGHAVPREEDALVAMLQHADEARVRAAISALGTLFQADAPRRKALAESRLRRLEELADEPETREAATALRRHLHRALS